VRVALLCLRERLPEYLASQNFQMTLLRLFFWTRRFGRGWPMPV